LLRETRFRIEEVRVEALVVTFKTGATAEEYTAANAGEAPAFAEVQGLLAKIWIADPDSNTFGGIKLFSDRAALDAYLESDLFKSIIEDPSVEDMSYRRYRVIEELTAKTQPGIQVTGAIPA
jgi:hypothetical protein